MISHIERVLFPAQTYPNQMNANKVSAKITTLVMIFLSNANLPPQLFSAVMASLMSATKPKSDNSTRHLPFSMTKAEKVLEVFKDLTGNTSSSSTLSENNHKFVSERTSCLKTAISRHNSAVQDSEHSIYISFTNAEVAPEATGVNVEEIQKPKAQKRGQLTKNLMTHTILADRFIHQNRNRKIYNRRFSAASYYFKRNSPRSPMRNHYIRKFKNYGPLYHRHHNQRSRGSQEIRSRA